MNIQFFADAITRADAEALIDVQLSDEIFKGVVAESMVLKHARKLANMTSKQTKLRVLDSLPVAGFIDGDTGLKPTSKVDWSNVYLNAEEIAVIVPIPENVLDDASYDIWTEIKPLIDDEGGFHGYSKIPDDEIYVKLKCNGVEFRMAYWDFNDHIREEIRWIVLEDFGGYEWQSLYVEYETEDKYDELKETIKTQYNLIKEKYGECEVKPNIDIIHTIELVNNCKEQ